MTTIEEFSEAASRLFGDFSTPRAIEAAEAGELPRELWAAIGTAGFGLMLVNEEQGGIGGTLSEAAAVLAAAGAHAVPGPFLELVIGNELLGLAGREPSSEPLAVALADQPVDPAGAVSVRRVPWAHSAGRVLVLAQDASGGCALVDVPAEGLEMWAEVEDASGEPMARVDLPAGTRWHPLPGMDFDMARARAGMLRGSQMMGAMRWCLDRTIDYTLERKQFGRQIARFQAVQHQMAEMASAVVAANAMLDAAIAAPGNMLLAAAARSRIGDACDSVFAIAHQVHGAIGFSYEYALHFRTRRLMAWRDQFGTVAHWRRVLATGFAGRKADDIWSVIAPCESAARAGVAWRP